MKVFDTEITRAKKFFRKFGLKDEIYLFLSNLAILLESGIGITESITAIKSEVTSKRFKLILEEVANKVQNGNSLSGSLNQAGVLSPRIHTLLKVGESSGQLVSNLNLINLQNDKEVVFRSKVRSSLLYAMVVFIIAIIVMFVTSLIILPKLAEFYGQLDVELPFLTQIMIDTGTFLANYGYIFLPISLLLIVSILYFMFSFPKTKYIGHSLLFHVPLIKKLLKYSETSSFAFLLGSEIKAGIPLLQALEDLPSTSTFKNYQALYRSLSTKVAAGSSLFDSLKSYPNINRLIPSQALTIISAGERSGKLSDSLIRIGEIYERKVDDVAKNLPTIIEPVIIILVGLFIAVIALATILPIYSLSTVF